jgi:Ca-activated chloride channel family protein
MNTEPQSGLFAGEHTIPLEGVHIDVRVIGACLDVTVTQRYRNREAVPVEAVYVFPLDEAAAVCGFAAVVGGKLIRGHVEERDTAFARYDDALQRGNGAFLLDQERPNVFTASVGNLRAGEVAELQIRYVALAAREGDALRLALPTTVSPRYVSERLGDAGQADAERVNPEHWPSVPYGLAIQVEIESDDKRLARVESPSHPVRVTLHDRGAMVELAQEQVALDRDFILIVENREADAPTAQVAREADGRRVVMVTFLPKDLTPVDQGHEVVFLLDCSGSMAGESISQAKRALSLCIRALRSEDTFNLVCFGSEWRALWETPRAFDEASLEEATRHFELIDADLGGTEILAPLTALLEAPHDPERPRRVLLLTDGQVSDEADVIALAERHADQSRVFAFGIGRGASEHLVRGTARASRGAAEMIFDGERVEPKVLRMFERVRTAALDDVRIDWKGLSVEQTPSRAPPVFGGDVLTVFARVERGSAHEVELIAGDRSWRVAIDLEHAHANGPIPTLWARERLRELDSPEPARGSAQRRAKSDTRRHARMVELGTRYGLLSSATSYVAVEERPTAIPRVRRAKLRRIPVALTNGCGGDGDAGRGLIVYASVSIDDAADMAICSAPMAADGEEDFGSLAAERDAAPVDRVFDLLMTQRADGGFAHSATLAAWLGSERAEWMTQAIASHGDAVVVTTVIIALFEREEPTRQSEWRPAVRKAIAWLRKQPRTFDATPLALFPPPAGATAIHTG